MVASREMPRATSIVDESDAKKILNFIADEKVVTLEMIVNRFSWIRWGDLFSIVGGLRRDGLVGVYQIGSLLEIRIKRQPWDVV